MAQRVGAVFALLFGALLLFWIVTAVTIVTRPANRLEDWLEAISGGAEDRSLFRPGGMGSGGLAGSGVECNALFTGDVLPGNR